MSTQLLDEHDISWQDDAFYGTSLKRPIDKIDDTLFIGNIFGRVALPSAIGAVVVCLTESEHANAPPLPTHVIEHFVGIDDVLNISHELLHKIVTRACAHIEEAVAKGHSVFVHCGAGVSRSATMVIAYLMKRDKLTFAEAMTRVENVRYCICPNPTFQNYLRWREGLIVQKTH